MGWARFGGRDGWLEWGERVWVVERERGRGADS